jgi:hypothetical protein
MPTMTIKPRIELPTEPAGIGNWTNEQIKRVASSSVEENTSVLTQDLFTTIHKFYQTKELISLANMSNAPYNEQENLLLPKGSNAAPAECRRFIIDIGHQSCHETNFINRPCWKRDNNFHSSFRSMIETHYNWCFAVQERPYIKKALERENLIHVVIYNRYYKPMSRTGKKVIPYYYVAAAATFLIAESSATLLYIGVSIDDFSKNDIFRANETGNKISYRFHGLGSLMLCIIQKMVHCVTNSHVVVAQVKNHADYGAIYFYLKHYFKIVSQENNYVYENKRMFGKEIFQEYPGLIYAISYSPIYLIYPWYLNNNSNIKLLENSIYHGAQYILQITDVQQKNIELPLLSLVQSCYSQLHNNKEAFICTLEDSKTEELTSFREAKGDSTGDIIHPNLNFWTIFLSERNLELMKLTPDSNEISNNYYYRMMALLLFQDENRYNDIRVFFFYIFQCISKLSMKNCPLFDYGTQNNNTTEINKFQLDVLEAVNVCEKIFGKDELKAFNLLTSDLDPIDYSGMENIHDATKFLLSKQLNPKYPGSQLELSMFAGIFNVDWKVFIGFSDTNEKLKGGDREWYVKEKPSSFLQRSIFNYTTKKGLNIQVPLIIDNEKYHIVGNTKLVSLLKTNETVINNHVCAWLNSESDKQFLKTSSELKSGNYVIYNVNFEYSEFTHKSIDVKNRLILAMMLDPLVSWVQYNYSYFPSLKLKIYDYLTMRPTCYISGSIIDAYMNYLQLTKPNSQVCLVTTATLDSFSNNPKLEQLFLDTTSKFRHYVCVVNVESNHWISVEFKFDGTKSSKIVLYIADSFYLSNNDKFIDFDNLKLATSLFKFITKLCIKADLHPDIKSEYSVKMRKEVHHDFWKRTCEIKKANYIEEQTNLFDCGICCLRRMKRIINSQHFSASFGKSSHFHDVCTSRQFRLLILQSLIPNEQENIHFVLRNEIAKRPTNFDQIDQHVKSPTSEYESEEDEMEHQMNMVAHEVNERNDEPPVDSEVVEMQNHEFIESSDNDLQAPLIPPMAENIEDTIANNKKFPEIESIRTIIDRNKETKSGGKHPRSENDYLRVEELINSSLDDTEDEDDEEESGEEEVNDEDVLLNDLLETSKPKLNQSTLQKNNDQSIYTSDPVYQRLQGTKLLQIIEEYDAPQDIPASADIVMLPKDIVEHLENNRKDELPDDLKEDWKKQAFHETQLSEKVARNAIRNILKNELRKLEADLKDIENRFDAKNKKLSQLPSTMAGGIRKELNSIKNEWIECKTKILLNDYQNRNNWMFHPRDNIKALRKNLIYKNNQIKEEYYAYVETLSGMQVTKKVDADFIRAKLDPDYLKYFEAHCEEKGWLCFDQKDKLQTIPQDMAMQKLQKKLKPLYQYDLNGDGDNILFLRIDLMVIMNPDGWSATDNYRDRYVIDEQTITFHYKTNQNSNYKPFKSQAEVNDMVSDELATKFLAKAIETAKKEANGGKISYQRIYDKLDKDFKLEEQGVIGKVQMQYENVRSYNFKIMEHLEISRIRYNIHKNQWEGIQRETNGTILMTTLREDWVQTNFPKYWEIFKNLSMKGMQGFLNVPVGDIIDVEPTMDVSNNPAIKYQQGQEDICIFSSLASILYYLGFVNESEIIFEMRKQRHGVYKLHPTNYLQGIMELIISDPKLKKFRKVYQFVKLSKSHNIFNDKLPNGEFKLVIIQSDDNQMSHAVTVNNKYIFDGNTSKCLPFTKEGINCCCGKNNFFVGIVFGYHFQFRPSQPQTKNKKKRRRKI